MRIPSEKWKLNEKVEKKWKSRKYKWKSGKYKWKSGKYKWKSGNWNKVEKYIIESIMKK